MTNPAPTNRCGALHMSFKTEFSRLLEGVVPARHFLSAEGTYEFVCVWRAGRNFNNVDINFSPELNLARRSAHLESHRDVIPVF